MANKVFCEICRDDVDYIVEVKPLAGKIRGKEYHFIGKEAKCSRCGAFVDVDEVSEYNLKAIYYVYNEDNSNGK